MLIVGEDEFRRVIAQSPNGVGWVLPVLSDMCRINTLTSITNAGSGHIGSSFSAMDLYMWALYVELNSQKLKDTSPGQDILFSSKGHDVPALYSVYFSLGILSAESLLSLRQLGGLHGHPDVSSPFIQANSGSLGMGISKARGRAWSKKFRGDSGRIFLIVGDGELQEGQNFEALQGAALSPGSEITIIVDHNKIQTDKRVDEISYVGSLENKFSAFGWKVARCDGHDFKKISNAYTELSRNSSRVNVLIADTIKGKGVSFMEAGREPTPGSIYEWHAGSPTREQYLEACNELLSRVNEGLKEGGISPIGTTEVSDKRLTYRNRMVVLGEQHSESEIKSENQTDDDFILETYGKELVRHGRLREDIVVFDADLSNDLRLRQFEKEFPERFIEVGIAEQDMVSMAGAVARDGFLPIVNSFGAFLASRANEQIYNNATELTKIIYVCHYAGLLPAGPGKSHQSIRDISLFGALPNMTIVQPSCSEELVELLDYCINESAVSCMLRLPLVRTMTISLPKVGTKLKPGIGTVVRPGADAVMFTAGPVMLKQAIEVRELLLASKPNIMLGIVNLPWVNIHDGNWLAEVTGKTKAIFVLEDHSIVGGLGDHVLSALAQNGLLTDKSFVKIGIEEFPECGDADDVLQYHRLDQASICNQITHAIYGNKSGSEG